MTYFRDIRHTAKVADSFPVTVLNCRHTRCDYRHTSVNQEVSWHSGEFMGSVFLTDMAKML